MSLQHLHLHVRNRALAQDFYARWFGLCLQRQLEDISFMTDQRDFLLALMDDAAPAAMPSWFHFGFRLDTASKVLDLHAAMIHAGVPIRNPVIQSERLVSFRCADPDDYLIEVYWEPTALMPSE